jgi:hypothetical protein
MSARTSFFAAILAGIAAVLALLAGLALAADAASPAHPQAALTSVQQSAVHPNTAIREQRDSVGVETGIHPNTADREQKARSVPDGAAQAENGWVPQQSSDWVAYRSTER